MIDIDVETNGLQWPYHRPFLFQAWDGTGEVEILDPRIDRERVQHWLDRAGEEGFRAWNSRFDLHMLESSGFTLPPQSSWNDGMVMAHIMDERTSVALKARAAALFGEEARDDEKAVKTWLTEESKRRRARVKEASAEGRLEAYEPPNYSDVPSEVMHPYAAQDLILTRKIWDTYEPKMNEDLKRVYALEMEVMGALYDAERRGLPVDEAAAHRMNLHVAENVERLNQRCIDLAGIDTFNPASSAQIAEALKRRGADLTFVTKTATGKPSMDAENLAAVDDELARAIEEFRAEFKMLGTYVLPMLNRSWDSGLRAYKEPFIHEGRIHANFRQVGARTGRMSCSDPNLQNLPRDDLRIRYLVKADPGMKLVTADLDAIELVLFVAFAGEGRLMTAIKDGEDMHKLVAKMIGLQDRRRSGGAVETARQRAKTFTYSQIYGGGVNTIRKQLGVSQKEARILIDRYHESFPEVGALQRRIAYRLEDTGYLKTPWGRRHRCWDARKESYKFVNYLVQGTAADLLKDALVRLHRQGVPIVACVHDELIAHCPEEDAEEVARLLVDALTDHPIISDKVPLSAEAQIVDRWSDAKTPGFTPAYEKDLVTA